MNDGSVVGPVDGHVIRITQKIWGYEREFVNTEHYCGKELFLHNWCSCSFHYHRLKSESFLVQQGNPIIRWFIPPYGDFEDCIGGKVRKLNDIVGGEPWWKSFEAKSDSVRMNAVKQWYASASQVRLRPGDIFNVPIGMVHQIDAGHDDCSIIEFSTHSEDSDSYRLLPGHGV